MQLLDSHIFRPLVSETKEMSAVELVEKFIEEQQNFRLHTQQLSVVSDEHQQARIKELELKVENLTVQKEKLRKELQNKASEWKSIKLKLLERTSIRGIIEPDSLQTNESRSLEDHNTMINLSEKEDYARSDDENLCFHDNKQSAHEIAQDCPCCTKFYRALDGECPGSNRSRQPPGSKHTYRAQMPGTPPGFWDVGFTQIND